jgi:hypothetical protein
MRRWGSYSPSTMIVDPPAGRRWKEIGDTETFVNQMRDERGLPMRGPIYGADSLAFLAKIAESTSRKSILVIQIANFM